MNWEAVGAIGEIVGAGAVVVTLLFLAIQVRLSTRATQESNRLERVSAIDRHAETIGRWRARLTENRELVELWLSATNNETLDDVDLMRLNNLWIEFVNTQRSNYVRALTVGEHGLAQQAVTSVAVEIGRSQTFGELWKGIKPWNQLVSPEFTDEVDSRRAEIEADGDSVYGTVPKFDPSAFR